MDTRLQWSTYRKWHLGYQTESKDVTSWPGYNFQAFVPNQSCRKMLCCRNEHPGPPHSTLHTQPAPYQRFVLYVYADHAHIYPLPVPRRGGLLWPRCADSTQQKLRTQATFDRRTKVKGQRSVLISQSLAIDNDKRNISATAKKQTNKQTNTRREREGGSRMATNNSTKTMFICWLVTMPPIGGRGRSISLFICLFVSLFISLFTYLFLFFLCQEDYEKTARPIWMKFSGKLWSDHGTTWINLGSIRANGSAGQRSHFITDIAIWFDCFLLEVLCCHLATENVMKLLILAFCYIATRGRGLLCFAPQLV